MNKNSGFIKAKRYIKDKKLISKKYGEILSVSLLLRSLESGKTKIRLQMYVKEQYRSDDFGANYKDLGLSEDIERYTAFLKKLSEFMERGE